MDHLKKLRFDRIEDWYYRWRCWKNIQAMKQEEDKPLEYQVATVELREIEEELKRLGLVCMDGIVFKKHYV